MLDPETRQRWRTNWIDCLRELADIEYQRSTWLSTKPLSAHYTFVEFVECYYDTITHLGYDELVRRCVVTAAEAQTVMRFHHLLEKYEPPNDDPYAVDAILTDPNWHTVVDAASEALNQLQKQIAG